MRLALSLHAADEALRSELMPVNDRYPARRRARRLRAFYEHKRRRVFVEYVMLAGVNDSLPAGLAAGRACSTPSIFKVNLIPYNPTGRLRGARARKAIEAFKDELERRGLSATVRLTRGRDIDAACGQPAAPRR